MHSNYTGPEDAGQHNYAPIEQTNNKYDKLNNKIFKIFLTGSLINFLMFGANKIEIYNQKKELEKAHTAEVVNYENVSITLMALRLGKEITDKDPNHRFKDVLKNIPYKTNELEEELTRLSESKTPYDTRTSIDRMIADCSMDSVLLANEPSVTKYLKQADRIYTHEEANRASAMFSLIILTLICNSLEKRNDKRKEEYRKMLSDLVR